MKKLKLTLSMLLAGVAGGTVVSLVDGKQQGIEVVADAPAEAVELKTADAGVLLAEASKAGGVTAIKCSIQGAGSNTPGRCYCTELEPDENTAGWLTDASECKTDVTIADGKVYVVEAAEP